MLEMNLLKLGYYLESNILPLILLDFTKMYAPRVQLILLLSNCQYYIIIGLCLDKRVTNVTFPETCYKKCICYLLYTFIER